MKPLIIRNRKITASDVKFIQAVVYQHWDRGRTHISRVLCTKWNWIQPNGRLKDMACSELLLTLYRKGLLDYPPPKKVINILNMAKSRMFIFIPLKKNLKNF